MNMTPEQQTKLRELKGRASKLASDAAKNDNWMRPTMEKAKFEDYGDDMVLEQEGWEQTDHWAHYYYNPIGDMAYEIFDAPGDGENRLYVIEELTSVFWETWANSKGAKAG